MASELPLSMNPWETSALQYDFGTNPVRGASGQAAAISPRVARQDPVIYPGLYSASGLDVMSVLMQIVSRPAPQVELGPVDCSVALVVSDLELPDSPIIYASDSFCEMTGYSKNEVLGRNWRFLLQPPKGKSRSPDATAIQLIQQATQNGSEVQLSMRNYKKNGKPFTNFLSIIPLTMQENLHRCSVGFHVELD